MALKTSLGLVAQQFMRAGTRPIKDLSDPHIKNIVSTHLKNSTTGTTVVSLANMLDRSWLHGPTCKKNLTAIKEENVFPSIDQSKVDDFFDYKHAEGLNDLDRSAKAMKMAKELLKI